MSRKLWFIIILIIIAIAVTISLVKFNRTAAPDTNMTKTLRLTSSAFNHNGLIPVRYTCDGNDFSPPLLISGAPAGTKSLVLIVDDPDSPTGTWDHWIIFNLPPDTAELKEGESPPGVLGQGTAQNLNYQGPCPGSGQHRYFFKLYALDSELPLPLGSGKDEVARAMTDHILDQTELIGLYQRVGV